MTAWRDFSHTKEGIDRELLGILHSLDNLDKHRFPPVVAGVGQIPHFATGDIHIIEMGGYNMGAIEDGQPLLTYAIADDRELDYQLVLASSIAFDKGSSVAAGQPVVPLLWAIRNFIASEVVAPLEDFL